MNRVMNPAKPLIRIRPKVRPSGEAKSEIRAPIPTTPAGSDISQLDRSFNSMHLDSPSIEINQDEFLEFVFLLGKEGKLNMNQVAYLTDVMDAKLDLAVKLDEFNLRSSFLNWQAKTLREQQERELQNSIMQDKIKSLRDSIANKEAELLPHKQHLENLLDELTNLHSRYRNFPENPRYAREKMRIESAIEEVRNTMTPYEQALTTLIVMLQEIS